MTETFSKDLEKDGAVVERGFVVPEGSYRSITQGLSGQDKLTDGLDLTFSTFRATGDNVIIGKRCRLVIRGKVTDNANADIDGASVLFSLKQDAVALLLDSIGMRINSGFNICIQHADILKHVYDRNFNPGNQVSKNYMYSGTDGEFVAQAAGSVNSDFAHLQVLREGGEVKFILPLTFMPMFGEDDPVIPPGVDLDISVKLTSDVARIFACDSTIVAEPKFKPTSAILEIFHQRVEPGVATDYNNQTQSGGPGYFMTTDIWEVREDSNKVLSSETTFSSDAGKLKYNIPPDLLLIKMFESALLTKSVTAYKDGHPFKHNWSALSDVKLINAGSQCIRNFDNAGGYGGKFLMQDELAQMIDTFSKSHESKASNDTISFINAAGVGTIPFTFRSAAWGTEGRLLTDPTKEGTSRAVDFGLDLKFNDTAFTGVSVTIFYITKTRRILRLYSSASGETVDII